MGGSQSVESSGSEKSLMQKLTDNHIVQYALELQLALEKHQWTIRDNWHEQLRECRFIINVPIHKYEWEHAHVFLRLAVTLALENVNLDLVCSNIERFISEQIEYTEFKIVGISCPNIDDLLAEAAAGKPPSPFVFAVDVETDANIAHLETPPSNYTEKLREYCYNKCVAMMYDFDDVIPTLGVEFMRGELTKCELWDPDVFAGTISSVEVSDLIDFYKKEFDVDIYFANSSDDNRMHGNKTRAQRAVIAGVNDAANARFGKYAGDVQGTPGLSVSVVLDFEWETLNVAGLYIMLETMPRKYLISDDEAARALMGE